MSAEEKDVWETKAKNDKTRYEFEKSMYKGPWKVPANKRTPKDPTAPKRPMSAFLAFSNKRRAPLKREHPDSTNSDLSKMLSISWKQAPDNVRKQYTEEEADLRERYKVEMAKWRKKTAEEKKAVPLQHAVMQASNIRPTEDGFPASVPTSVEYRQYGHDSHPDVGGPVGHHAPQAMYGDPYSMGGSQPGEYVGYNGMPQGQGNYSNVPSVNHYSQQPIGGGHPPHMSTQMMSELLYPKCSIDT